MNRPASDCQGEDDYATFYRALPPFEKKLFKAVGIAFQLKDFGHNVIDEIDGECFEQDVEQMARFTEANKAALAAAMEIVNPEFARLNAELTEARERLQAIIDWADLAMKHPEQFETGGARNLTGPVFDAARASLTKGETDA